MHILVNKIKVTFLSPLFSRGFFFLLSFALIFISCGPSNPRYQTSVTNEKKTEKKKENKRIRFSSANVEEEIKTDDKKVNANEVASRFNSSTVNNNSVSASKNIEVQKMMDVILSYLGTPYKFGGESKSGMDCSAFTKEVFLQSTNYKLPRSTSEQIKVGETISQQNMKFGDLIFFNTTGVNPSHVGIFIGDNMFAHASQAYGVTISSFESSYYKKHFTEARRLSND